MQDKMNSANARIAIFGYYAIGPDSYRDGYRENFVGQLWNARISLYT